jgi:indole-3-glycerol phosphate synthase/phosphoribosylanthranilate isomerase/anthranilate synthase/indole-3-glycerol phosphate synthase/phosphoribosylanthranilate isomerase
MTQVKICGLRRVDDAMAAVEAGAQMLGLVFAPSRRRIDPGAAHELVERVKDRSPIKVVGVFVNEDPNEINRVARLCRLDYAQLSGGESDETVGALHVPAIQVFHVGEDGINEDLAHRVERSSAELVLLDTARDGSYGGTGKAFAWTGGKRIERPFLLAGGLRTDNAEEAVRAMRPWGLDVSSGVETGGDKDPEKIKRFIARVRELTP